MIQLKNILTILFWPLVFLAFALCLQHLGEYHFYIQEQNQLFLNEWYYIMETLPQPGGFTLVISEWLVQYFLLPYRGAAILALLFTLIAFFTWLILRKAVHGKNLILWTVLPSVCLMFIQMNFNYLTWGNVSFLFMQLLVWSTLFIRNAFIRSLTEPVAVIVLYLLAGPVAVVYALFFVLYEWINKNPRAWISLLLPVLVFVMAWLMMELGIVGEWRFTMLPDIYFHPRLRPDTVILFSWGIFIALYLMAVTWPAFFSGSLKGAILNLSLQGGVLFLFLWWGIPKYHDQKSVRTKKVDYYCRTEQWDKIIEESKGQPTTNYLSLCYLNMALAQQGRLGDDLFAFDQRQSNGLIVQPNKSSTVSILLSEINYVLGDIAGAQQMAFEASVDGGNGRMLKRLVETNLIFGHYPVAEKYITILEKTACYRSWATEQRKFLYNDEAVLHDPVYGFKRKCIPSDNYMAPVDGPKADWQRLSLGNPTNRLPIIYLGCLYLLDKELLLFKDLMETYYGTEVLPELPRSFQEALITVAENNMSYLERYHISPAIMERFVVYKKQVLANKNNSSALPGLLFRSYGDTYWFYYMFK